VTEQAETLLDGAPGAAEGSSVPRILFSWVLLVSLVIGVVGARGVPVGASDDVEGPSVVATITVGSQPWGVAFSPDGAVAYVGNSGSNSISIIDVTARTAQTLVVPDPHPGGLRSSPAGVVVTPAGKAIFTAYTALTTFAYSSPDVAVDPGVAGRAGCTFPLAITLHGNGQTAYVACADGRIVAVSADDLSATQLEFAAGSVDDIAYVPKGSKPTDAIASLRNHTSGDQASKGYLHLSTSAGGYELPGFGLSLAVDSTGTWAYVGDSTGVFSAFAIADHPAGPVFTVTVEAGSELRGIGLSPDGQRAYVTNKSSDEVAVIDLARQEVVTEIAVGGGPQRIAISPDGRTALVTNNVAMTVSMIDIPLAPPQTTQSAVTFVSVAPSAATVGDDGYAPALGGGSGAGAFVLTSGDPSVCSTSSPGGTWVVAHLGQGSCELTLIREGDADHVVSAPAVQTYVVEEGATSGGISEIPVTVSRQEDVVTLAWDTSPDAGAVIVDVCDAGVPTDCGTLAIWLGSDIGAAFPADLLEDPLLPGVRRAEAFGQVVLEAGVTKVLLGHSLMWLTLGEAAVLGCGTFTVTVTVLLPTDVVADQVFFGLGATVGVAQVSLPCPEDVFTAELWGPFLDFVPIRLSAVAEGAVLRLSWTYPVLMTPAALEVFVIETSDESRDVLVAGWLSPEYLANEASDPLPEEVAAILIAGEGPPASILVEAGVTRTLAVTVTGSKEVVFVTGLLACGPAQAIVQVLDGSEDRWVAGGIGFLGVDIPCPPPANGADPMSGDLRSRAVLCKPAVPAAGSRVTCRLSGGDGGTGVEWRASYNPTFAGATVVLDAAGEGGFSFVVPAAALGSPLVLEVIGWGDPMVLAEQVGAPVPGSIPAGGGPQALMARPLVPAALLLVLAVLLGRAARRSRRTCMSGDVALSDRRT
jgi:YVTN family beta-propeller protein